jgi:hypothetical protein
VKETSENDNAFSVEADIVKLNEVGERLLVEGYIGKITEICFTEDLLEIKGLEGNLKVNLKEKQIQKFINKKMADKRKFRV